MRWIIMLLVGPLLIFGCVFIVLGVPLPAPLPEPFSQGRNVIVIPLALVMGLAYVLLVGMMAVGQVAGVSGTYDEAFARLDLHRVKTLWLARRYEGMIGGRQVEIEVQAVRGLYSVRLRVTIDARIPVRAAIVAGRPLLDCQDCPEVDIPGEAPGEGGRFFAADPGWMQALLDNGSVRDALGTLFGQSVGSAELYFQPERLWLHLRLASDARDVIGEWLEALVAIADAAEKVSF